MPQTITAVGSLRSDESVTLRSENAGRISAIAFQEGQRVQKGAQLVRLDPAVPQAEFEQAKADLTLAKAKFDRAVDLANRNYISGQAKDEAENNFKVAEASLRLRRGQARQNRHARVLRHHRAASVSIGDYVKKSADLVNLESMDPLKVELACKFHAQRQPGQSLTVTLDAMPGQTYDGEVLAVNPLVDAAGRTMSFAPGCAADATLRPGMFARVRLVTRDQSEAMVVPEQALVPQGSEQYVFEVVDNKAVRVKIETGQRRDGEVEVINGLKPGDVVVTAGQLKIRDGSPVTSSAPWHPRTQPGRPRPSGSDPCRPAQCPSRRPTRSRSTWRVPKT